MSNPRSPSRASVLVVGSGPHFLSGISYYTHRLATALGQRADTSVLLLRRLLPARFYPGRARVGQRLVDLDWSGVRTVYDGIDWYWGRSLVPALRLLRRQPPDVVIFQWWTGAVLHTLLLLASIARRRGAKIIIEFHEVQDIGELEIPLAGTYVRAIIPLLLARADGYVVHSEFDRTVLRDRYELGEKPIKLIPHGMYDSYRTEVEAKVDESEVTNLLYFGVIRPFKGVEDLIRAFELLDGSEIDGYTLTIVGETWEGWVLPAELVAASPYRDRIIFINRYVDDSEVGAIFAAADIVVLPYHRSSSSGPLQIAMGSSKRVVVTSVGGLVAATEGYERALLVPPRDPDAIVEAIRTARLIDEVQETRQGFTFGDAAESYVQFMEGLVPLT